MVLNIRVVFTAMNYSGGIFFLQSILNPASLQAERINRLFTFFNLAAGGMLLLVVFLVVFICIKFRRRIGDESESTHPKSNNKLEIIMIGGPTLLLAWFFYQTVSTIHVLTPPLVAGQQPDVVITGHQWWWEVAYPSAKVITANEVHLPVGKHLLLELRTADVIHDWWVPQLGSKVDLIPNKSNYLYLDINKPEEYLGSCSEFCGAQHAWMRIHVIAQKADDFASWLNDNAGNAIAPEDSLALTGAALFQSKTCGGCHRIQGTEAMGNAGPDLTHLSSRKQLLTGVLENNASNLFKWISHPQEIKPGAHMPNFIFSKDTVNAIVHYLNQLR